MGSSLFSTLFPHLRCVRSIVLHACAFACCFGFSTVVPPFPTTKGRYPGATGAYRCVAKPSHQQENVHGYRPRQRGLEICAHSSREQGGESHKDKGP